MLNRTVRKKSALRIAPIGKTKHREINLVVYINVLEEVKTNFFWGNQVVTLGYTKGSTKK